MGILGAQTLLRPPNPGAGGAPWSTAHVWAWTIFKERGGWVLRVEGPWLCLHLNPFTSERSSSKSLTSNSTHINKV